MPKKDKKYILSLFSSAGIGELGVKASGLDILLSNEILTERCLLYKENYPETNVIQGDIWEKANEIIKRWKSFKVGYPFIIYATPPCQGMSFNGIGKILNEVRSGKRPKEDPRNRLIIPTIEIIKALKPKWVILENVPTMQNTIIRTESNQYLNIIDYIFRYLSDDYIGKAEIVNCADYGIAQTRVRLITILSRTKKGKAYFKLNKSFVPHKTHSEKPHDGLKPWVTLRDAIFGLPKLSAEPGYNEDKHLPWHIVPIMKPEKFWWVKNTPSNETAYNNQCCQCGYQGNRKHGMCFINGIHQSKKDTPIYCEKCGALLPRPTMIDKQTGERRLIKGFDSAYKRMSWDSPAPTLTQNFQYEASDKKLHPEQNRVLSIYEALKLQTISDYSYKFSIYGKVIPSTLCCQIIGESVPPLIIELICKHILTIENENK